MRFCTLRLLAYSKNGVSPQVLSVRPSAFFLWYVSWSLSIDPDAESLGDKRRKQQRSVVYNYI